MSERRVEACIVDRMYQSIVRQWLEWVEIVVNRFLEVGFARVCNLWHSYTSEWTAYGVSTPREYTTRFNWCLRIGGARRVIKMRIYAPTTPLSPLWSSTSGVVTSHTWASEFGTDDSSCSHVTTQETDWGFTSTSLVVLSCVRTWVGNSSIWGATPTYPLHVLYHDLLHFGILRNYMPRQLQATRFLARKSAGVAVSRNGKITLSL
jgi:hypothetical protein